VHKKPGFSLDKYDWRNEVALGSSPRSLPLNGPSGITLIDAHAAAARSGNGRAGEIRGQSVDGKKVNGVEVGLEELIEGGKGKREKRSEYLFMCQPSPRGMRRRDDVKEEILGKVYRRLS